MSTAHKPVVPAAADIEQQLADDADPGICNAMLITNTDYPEDGIFCWEPFGHDGPHRRRHYTWEDEDAQAALEAANATRG